MDVSGRATGEFAVLRRIAAALPGPPEGQTWIGDDAAILGRHALLAIDAVVSGVHTDLRLATIDDLGWKALAVNVSDIAAMGGRPTAAVVAVAGPPGTDLDALYRGIAAAAERWSCPVVGGDLSTAPVLVVTVAVLGDGSGDPSPVRRSGARPGDTVWATGPLGAAAAGLRQLRSGSAGQGALSCAEAYRRPLARLDEGTEARLAGATAMIDVSDGLGADLGHILDASGVGARLDLVPVAEGATEAEALGGGEDYELVFTTPPAAPVAERFQAAGLRAPLRMGACTGDPAERTVGGEPLPAAGWEHPWA